MVSSSSGASKAPELLVQLEGHLTGADRDLQAVLRRRDRARPVFVVGAVGIVGEVEVDEQAAVGKGLRLEIAAGAIGLLPGERVGEGKEEAVLVVVEGERGLNSVDLETDAAESLVRLQVAGRRLHLAGLLHGELLHLEHEAQARVRREVAQAGEGLPLRGGERAGGVRAEEVALLPAEALEIVHRCGSYLAGYNKV